MRAIAYEAWASRLWQFLLALQFALSPLIAMRLFLPPILAVVALVLTTLSPTFILVMPFVFGLGGVFGERLRNSDGVVKCLNTPSIKFRLSPILEAILEVEE